MAAFDHSINQETEGYNHFVSDLPPQVFRHSMGSAAGAHTVLMSNKMTGADVRGMPFENFVFHQPMIEAAGSAFQSAFQPSPAPHEAAVPGTAAYLNKVTQPRNFPSAQ